MTLTREQIAETLNRAAGTAGDRHGQDFFRFQADAILTLISSTARQEREPTDEEIHAARVSKLTFEDSMEAIRALFRRYAVGVTPPPMMLLGEDGEISAIREADPAALAERDRRIAELERDLAGMNKLLDDFKVGVAQVYLEQYSELSRLRSQLPAAPAPSPVPDFGAVWQHPMERK